MINSASELVAIRQPVIISIANGHTALRKLSDAGEFALASRLASALSILQQVESDIVTQLQELQNKER